MNKGLLVNKPSKYKPLLQLATIAILLSFARRLVLLLTAGKHMNASFINIISGFFIGFAFDLLVSLFIILPFAVQISFTNNFIYTPKGKWIAFGVFAIVLGIFLFTSFELKGYFAIVKLEKIFLLFNLLYILQFPKY